MAGTRGGELMQAAIKIAQRWMASGTGANAAS
jgi:hypothetical protein